MVLVAVTIVWNYLDSFAAICVCLLLYIVAEVLAVVPARDRCTTIYGRYLDITADQLIETVFWFFFLFQYVVPYQIPFWMPVFLLVCNTITIVLHVHALQTNQDTSSEGGMLHTRFGTLLAAAVWSRALIAAIRVVGFGAFVLTRALFVQWSRSEWTWPDFTDVGVVMISILSVLYLIRLVVFVMEGQTA